MAYTYKILSQIRANGKYYLPNETLPPNLKKVNYNELVEKGFIEQLSIVEPNPPATKPITNTEEVTPKRKSQTKEN